MFSFSLDGAARRERNLRENVLNAVIKTFYFIFIINTIVVTILSPSTLGTGLRSKVKGSVSQFGSFDIYKHNVKKNSLYTKELTTSQLQHIYRGWQKQVYNCLYGKRQASYDNCNSFIHLKECHNGIGQLGTIS